MSDKIKRKLPKSEKGDLEVKKSKKKSNRKHKSESKYIEEAADELNSDMNDNEDDEEKDEESDNREVEQNSPKKLKESKMKHYMHFSIALINQSYHNDNQPWEAEEKARLLILIKNTLQLDSAHMFELVQECNFMSPSELAALQDEGMPI